MATGPTASRAQLNVSRSRWLGRVRSSLRRLSPLVVLVILAACGTTEQPLNSLDPLGPIAERIDGLFWLVFWIATAIFFVVQGGLLFSVIFFRDRKGRTEEPKQTHGNVKLEILWTAIPTLILAGIAVPTFQAVFELADCPSDALTVEVIGHQWWFEYRYPDFDVTSANVMVIPTGTEVCAEMTSDDVLHNFWVPKLNGKRYLVPGQQTELRLRADEPGEFWGHCAEFCGLSHAKMRARVEALVPSDFDAWVVNQQTPQEVLADDSLAAQGQQVFLNGACTGCHNLNGVNDINVDELGVYGPDLTHFATRNVFAGASLPAGLNPTDADWEAELRLWLSDPPTVKPGSFMGDQNLTAEDIDAVIAYLRTLD
ncbi:MAG: cytochrome c oxidase subunit II [Acidimicrobiia bacterium]|nr:cytochrome c oxidase subunit II [Acidimicrobiia bacterium]